MNELEKTLQRILEKSIELAEQTGEFVIEQAPLLLQEFYRWHMSKSIFFMLVGILISIIIFKVASFFGRKEPFKFMHNKGYSFEKEMESQKYWGRYFNPNEEYMIGMYVLRVIGYVVLITVPVVNLYNIIFILVAPKLYLIEYFIK